MTTQTPMPEPSGHDPDCWVPKSEHFECTCKSYGETPDWRGEEEERQEKVLEREHDASINVRELLSQCEIEITRANLIVPFSHDSTKKHVAAVLVKGKNRKWKVEGHKSEFGGQLEAALWYIELVESQRAKMLNQAFAESGI